MRIYKTLMICAVILCTTTLYADNTTLIPGRETISVALEESDIYRTVLRFDLGNFSKESVEINGETHYTISLGRENTTTIKGDPALPRICRSIIIPDNGNVRIDILSSEYVDFPNTPVAPSRGIIYRTDNPADIPYEFSPVYEADSWYPHQIADVREPFILRDYRGTVVDVYPFQYNPVSRTLRVYTSVTVEVTTDDKSGASAVASFDDGIGLVSAFDQLYAQRFINYETAQTAYTPMTEQGDMLIITHDDFHDAMMPLIEWKRQKGIKTTIIDVSAIGNNSTAIKAFIQDFYDSTDLAWILLIGDGNEIDPPYASGGASDPSYAKLAGSDDYPDAFIGRFSAQSVADVETQVERTLTYEQNPPGSGWFGKGSGIASSEGAGIGHNFEIDYEHSGLMRTDLLGFTYTEVDEIYDPGALASTLSNALNAGRGLVNYTGHGSTTAWATTGFSNTHINNLTNNNMLPLVISVGCINGNFDGYTCFAETWQRATNAGSPTGAIASYMSSINQSWAPPMDAQDEIVDLLVAESMITVGGLCYSGSCKMIDLNGSDGVEMYDTWHIFGDPSIQVWHTDPLSLSSVSHGSEMAINATTFDIDLGGVESALCVLYADGINYGQAYSGSGGLTTINIDQVLPIGEDIILTVTADNYLPYTATLQVISPDGPYVVYDQTLINDLIGGNDNGEINHGESINLDLQLKNVGPAEAVNVSAILSTTDSFIVITDAEEYYGNISGDDTVNIAEAFGFDVSQDIPDGHLIPLTLTVSDDADGIWTSEIYLTAHAPILGFLNVAIDDTEENDNGVFDPDETIKLAVTLENTGSGIAEGLTVTLSSLSSFITMTDNIGTFSEILPSGGTAENGLDNFTISASIICPRGEIVAFELNIADGLGYAKTIEFDLTISDREIICLDDFSVDLGWTGLGGSGEWTIGPAVGGTGSDGYGNIDPTMDHSPSEDNQVLGNDLTTDDGDYNSYLSNTYWVTSPVLSCLDHDRVVLSYYRWLGVENGYDNALMQVYDGSQWVTLFDNGSILYIDSNWVYEEYDLSATADGNAELRIRFGIGTTDASWNYSGWNIDDLMLRGFNIRPMFICGDADGDEEITVGDAVYLINYVFKNGTAPPIMVAAEVTNDGVINVGDVVFLINRVFKDGPAPQCP
ncbi:MAG: hypothetical protein GY841_18435 [FCB group bacterium]|nr:hypothetical protein [FCB group bacterium]